MKYKIVADSSVNLRKINSKIEFETVPLKIITSEKEFIDDDNLNAEEMVDYLKDYKGKSGTACPSVEDWLKAFDGADIIFCFTITSTLSGSYNSARLAKEDYESKHPSRKVFVIDTLSTGPEMTLLIEKVQDLIEQKMKDFKSIYERVIAYKEKTALMFSLESLRNLANNGRVNAVVAKLAGVLGIRVVGRASVKGDLEPMDKCRGEKKALSKILHHMKDMGFAGGKVRIDHCGNVPSASELKELILKEFPLTDIKIAVTNGLCSFYAEHGGLLVGFERA